MKIFLLIIVCFFTQLFTVQAQLVSTVAGSYPGYVDATGADAQFNNPNAVAVDGIGNIYIADTNNHRIRKMTPVGVVTTFAGSSQGFSNGTSSAAKFNFPMGVAADPSGNIYVADSGNNRIRKITSTGVVTTIAGGPAGFSDNAGVFARFNSPQDIAIDVSGNLYVADVNNARIRKITPTGIVSTLAGSGVSGFNNGTGSVAQFNTPMGVTVDAIGNVFVADTFNDKIRKITPAGIVTTFATVPTPTKVLVDAFNNIYVTNSANASSGHQVFKINASGVGGTALGTTVFGGIDGYGAQVRFYRPVGMAKNAAGDVYIADSGYNRIRKINIAPVAPFLSNISASSVVNSAAINYTIGTNNTPTTSIINYGLSATSLTNQVAGFLVNVPNSVSDVAVLPNLLPNTTYYYKVFATNAMGSTSSEIGSFTTKTNIEYKFNNTYNNVTGNTPFSTSGTFATDRNGIANEALNFAPGASSVATISNIPVSNSARSVSLWYNKATNFYGNLFAYGTNAAYQNFGVDLWSSGIPVFMAGGNNNYNFGVTTASNTWVHIVVTYDGTSVRLYQNGILLNTVPSSLNTLGTSIRIGGRSVGSLNPPAPGTIAIDDLQIYNYALTQTEVTSLFTYNNVNPCVSPIFSNFNGFYDESSLTTTSLNGITGTWSPAYNNTATTTYTFTPTVGQCANSISVIIYINNPINPLGPGKRLNKSSDLISLITIYPNPVNNVLNIETELKLQSVEIYNTQGQKVLSSNQNQINVSDLAAGMYMVRIQDTDNAIATKKIVKQ